MISEYAEVEVERYGGKDMVAGPPERLETTLAGDVEEYWSIRRTVPVDERAPPTVKGPGADG